MMEYTYAYCWYNGLVEFGSRVPDDAFEIAHAPKYGRKLRDAVRAWTIMGDGDGHLWIPGIYSYSSHHARCRALAILVRRVHKTMGGNCPCCYCDKSGECKRESSQPVDCDDIRFSKLVRNLADRGGEYL